MIPTHIHIREFDSRLPPTSLHQAVEGILPDEPGVYYFYDAHARLLYVGKATSLTRRVNSYFTKAHDNRIAQMVLQIAEIRHRTTPTVIEALVLEANEIKRLKPKFNVLQRDDKSFAYLVITNEPYPRPVIMRGHELRRLHVDPFAKHLSVRAGKKFLVVFGPYLSAWSVRKALDLVRRAIPWSECVPPATPSSPPLGRGGNGSGRPCFDSQIGKCPGVCTGAISRRDYRRIIGNLILFFEGKKPRLIAKWRKEMEHAAKKHAYEHAADIRNKLFALEHIQDIALITREGNEDISVSSPSVSGIDLDGRIEAYDISNISGTSAVGSMVVFEEGQPAKKKYRKFRIRTVKGSNDVAMLEEVLRRRLKRSQTYPQTWPLPEVMVIDGGEGQVNRARAIAQEFVLSIPIVGIAKGFDRKQDRLVFDPADQELVRVVGRGKELFQRARDEAHRFAVAYHRTVRSSSFRGRKQRRKQSDALRHIGSDRNECV